MNRGFTIIELLIVISMMAVISAIAYPSIMDWVVRNQVRSDAQNAMIMVRSARSESISTNLEYSVVVDIDNNKLSMREGNASAGSSSWSTIREIDLTDAQRYMRLGADCSGNTGSLTLKMSPRGYADMGDFCIHHASRSIAYSVGIKSRASGRSVMERVL